MSDSPDNNDPLWTPEYTERYQTDYAPDYKKVIEWALSSLTQLYSNLAPSQILDLGCGAGYSTRLLRDRFARTKITAIDICKDGIRICPTLKLVDFIHGTLESLRSGEKIQDESFELVFSSFVTYDPSQHEEANYELLVDDYLHALTADGIGMFVHNGKDCERFLAATNLCHSHVASGDKTLRPVKAEWTIIAGVEYGFVIARALENNFDT